MIYEDTFNEFYMDCPKCDCFGRVVQCGMDNLECSYKNCPVIFWINRAGLSDVVVELKPGKDIVQEVARAIQEDVIKGAI